MRMMDRYIGISFLKAFGMALFTLVFMFMTIAILENLRIETDQPRYHLYLYFLYLIPQNVAIVLPAALMFAVSFTVAQFTVAREMVALHSAGISFFRAVLTILWSGPVLAIFLFLFQNFVVTKTNDLAAAEMDALIKDRATIRDVVWQKNFRGSRGYYFVYFLDRENNRIVGGFNYLELDSGDNPVRMIQSRSASYDPEKQVWLFKDGMEMDVDPELKITDITPFIEREYKLPEDMDFFAHPSRDPSLLNLLELQEEIDMREKRGITSVGYRVQYHANLAFPFMTIIVTIVGVLTGGGGNLRSGGPLIRSLLMSIGTIFVYQLVYRMGMSLGTSGVVPPAVGGWGPTLVFLFIALFFAVRTRK